MQARVQRRRAKAKGESDHLNQSIRASMGSGGAGEADAFRLQELDEQVDALDAEIEFKAKQIDGMATKVSCVGPA